MSDANTRAVLVERAAEQVKSGKLTSFPQIVKLEEDGVVVICWMVHESRGERGAQ